ncbi:MAG TPA: ribonuclease H [Polyangiaceae bacterium]|nr:ribonuclease H [Polyangiaceae bacterium]
MPWMEATLRGQRVLARVKADRTLDVRGGRVEIRYGPTAERAYHAAARNLEVAEGGALLDDAACVPASGGPTTAAAPARRAPETESAPVGAWLAYTDGACSGNPGPAGCGVVIVAPGGKTHEGHEYLGEATNNVAELTAILRALEWIPGDAGALVVYTDSKYAIGVLQKDWKAKANQDLVERTKQLVKARRARLVYVPGHQGVPLNELADTLAREAVQTRRSQRPSDVSSGSSAR